MPPISSLTDELDSRYTREGESLVAKNPDWEIEIGDTKDASTFHPQIKLMPWDNETNFSMRLEPTGLFAPATPVISYDRNRVLWAAGDLQAPSA